jgi:hypothetical protein
MLTAFSSGDAEGDDEPAAAGPSEDVRGPFGDEPTVVVVEAAG